jgi:hypothetical protein
MFSTATAEALSVLLNDFLSDKPDSDAALRRFLKPIVNRFCAQRAHKLPLDLREEVLQETLLILVGSGCERYEAMRNTAPGYVYSAVRTALQSIRRRNGLTPARIATTEFDVDFDSLAEAKNREVTVFRRLLADRVLQSVEPRMRRLLWRVYINDESQEIALAEAKLSRFAFDRRRKAIARSLSLMGRVA